MRTAHQNLLTILLQLYKFNLLILYIYRLFRIVAFNDKIVIYFTFVIRTPLKYLINAFRYFISDFDDRLSDFAE